MCLSPGLFFPYNNNKVNIEYIKRIIILPIVLSLSHGLGQASNCWQGPVYLSPTFQTRSCQHPSHDRSRSQMKLLSPYPSSFCNSAPVLIANSTAIILQVPHYTHHTSAKKPGHLTSNTAPLLTPRTFSSHFFPIAFPILVILVMQPVKYIDI